MERKTANMAEIHWWQQSMGNWHQIQRNGWYNTGIPLSGAVPKIFVIFKGIPYAMFKNSHWPEHIAGSIFEVQIANDVLTLQLSSQHWIFHSGCEL